MICNRSFGSIIREGKEKNSQTAALGKKTAYLRICILTDRDAPVFQVALQLSSRPSPYQKGAVHHPF